MINAYQIGVGATLEDDVTPSLMRIVEWADKAEASLRRFSESVRSMSGGSAALARNLDRAARSSAAFGESAAGITRASYAMDSMAASSADLARNMAAVRAETGGLPTAIGANTARNLERASAAAVKFGESADSLTRVSYILDTMAASSADIARNLAAARGEAASMRLPPIRGGGSGGRGGGEGGGSERHGGSIGTGVGVASAGMLYGAYENARLQDQNVKAVATAQVPFDQWQPSIENLRAREMAYASKYAWATGGHIEPFGESLLEGARLLRTLSPDKQKQMMDFAMPYIALESKLKGVSLPEATQAFIGLSHMAGAYNPKQAEPLYESMLQASLTSHASLGQIARAASYALPALHAAGANASDVMLLVATMMQGGIMNTKSGTWLNAMAGNTLPNTLGSGLFSNKKQNEALHDLGLYRGNHAQFYANGQMDLMKIVSILAEDRQRIAPLRFNALLKNAFGTQGQRGASFFSEDTTLQNLHALSDLKNFSQPPMDVGRMMQQVSTVGLADQTIANANITLMNGTATLMGPINSALSASNSFFSWTAALSKNHPVAGGALDFGMLFAGAVAGLGVWSGAKGASRGLEKGVVTLSKYIARGTAALIAEAATVTTGAEVGAAAVAAGAAGVALTAAILGGIAYVIQRGMNSVTSKMTSDQQAHFYQDVAGGGPVSFSHNVTKPAGDKLGVGAWIHNHFYVDSQEVATKLIPPKGTGPTSFNGDASPFSPAMGAIP